MMKNTNYTKEEINNAIYKVMITQFKKDAKEAHKIVEAAGYQISKDGNGHFDIYNEETRRRLSIGDERYSYTKQRGYRTIYHGDYSRHRSEFSDKFDFVGCLEKPFNTEYYTRNYKFENSSAKDKYDRLKSAKWSVEYDEKNISRIMKELEKLQKDLIYYAEAKIKSQMKLNEIRDEFGLIK